VLYTHTRVEPPLTLCSVLSALDILKALLWFKMRMYSLKKKPEPDYVSSATFVYI